MKRATVCWAAAGVFLSLCTLILLSVGLHSSPALRVDPGSVTEAAQQVMACAVSGDYETLSSLLYGSPDLGTPPSTGESAEGMIWNAFLGSIQYEVSDTVCILDSRVALDLRIVCLDIAALTDALQKTAPRLLEEKAKALGDESLIYDQAHGYREAFLADVMQAAAAQVLSDHPQTLERELKLQFVRSDGRWQVVPTGELLQFLSGYTAS